MNDKNLDDILDRWESPSVPPSLRENLRRRVAAAEKPARFSAWRLSAAGALCAGLFLVAITQAFPQTRKDAPAIAQLPFTVSSEAFRYGEDGSVVDRVFLTSYNDHGKEIVLDRSFPDHFLEAFHFQIAEFHANTLAPIFLSADELARVKAQAVVSFGFGQIHLGKAATLVSSGCVQGGTLAGRQSILNFPSVGIRPDVDSPGRMTVWMAPALGCFALKTTYEERQSNGTYRLLTEKRALKVAVNAKPK